MVWGFELTCALLGAAWFAVRVGVAADRRSAALEAASLCFTAALLELAAVRAAGLYQTSTAAWAAPMGVALGPALLRAALIDQALLAGLGAPRGLRPALLLIVELALLETLGAGLELWRWSDPGLLGFSWLAPPAWLCSAWIFARSMARARALAPLTALIGGAVAVLALWFGVVGWLPYPSSAALALTGLRTELMIAASALLAIGFAWTARRGHRSRGLNGPATSSAPSAHTGWSHPAGALAMAGALAAAVFVLPDPSVRTHAKEPSPVHLAQGERVLVLVGDVMLGRGVAELVDGQGSFDRFFEGARPMLAGADLTFGNLESVIAEGGERKKDGIALRAPPRAAAALGRAGFDVLSMANNHVADFGHAAMVETREHLRAAGVTPVGVGPTDAPQTPLIVERDGHRIGFLAYCDPRSKNGCTHWDRGLPDRAYRAHERALARDLAALRPQVDTLVVSLHWGTEGRTDADPVQRALGRRIIDLGADVVAGHHPHMHQEAERYGRGVILHSMGNFVFDQRSRPEFMESGLYRIVVGPRGLTSAEVLPMRYRAKEYAPASSGAGWQAIERPSRLPALRP